MHLFSRRDQSICVNTKLSLVYSQEAGGSNTHDSQAIKLGLVFWMTVHHTYSDTDFLHMHFQLCSSLYRFDERISEQQGWYRISPLGTHKPWAWIVKAKCNALILMEMK